MKLSMNCLTSAKIKKEVSMNSDSLKAMTKILLGVLALAAGKAMLEEGLKETKSIDSESSYR